MAARVEEGHLVLGAFCLWAFQFILFPPCSSFQLLSLRSRLGGSSCLIRQDPDMAVFLCAWPGMCLSEGSEPCLCMRCAWPHDICVICAGRDIHGVSVVCACAESVSHVSTCVHMHVCALEIAILE